uniref:Mannan-binding lectin serine protease 1-like n=1 Tax=Cyprinodon variegatus TaxID=28743 RepID=A0A3Q2D0C5_CYPVA
LWLVLIPPALSLTLTQLLSEMYGIIMSPGFPEPYPRDTERNWNISVPAGFRISLFFTHFDLEPSYLCEYDYVKVSKKHLLLGQGLSESPSELLQQIQGSRVITSHRNSLSIRFSSDFSNEECGRVQRAQRRGAALRSLLPQLHWGILLFLSLWIPAAHR